MEVKIMIAMIAGATSLFVAVLSLLATLISSRSSRKATENLEGFKQSFLEKEKMRDIEDHELVAVLEELMCGLNSIQKVKNDILVVLNAYEDNLSTEEALTLIKNARVNLFSSYENGFGRLNITEKRSYHAAKNCALSIETILLSDLKSKIYAGQLAYETKNKVKELRDELSDHQNVLRDNRTDRIMRRTLGLSSSV